MFNYYKPTALIVCFLFLVACSESRETVIDEAAGIKRVENVSGRYAFVIPTAWGSRTSGVLVDLFSPSQSDETVPPILEVSSFAYQMGGVAPTTSEYQQLALSYGLSDEELDFLSADGRGFYAEASVYYRYLYFIPLSDANRVVVFSSYVPEIFDRADVRRMIDSTASR